MSDDAENAPHVHGPNCSHSQRAIKQAERVECPARNEPCWCGSKKKYKKCHLRADELYQAPG